MIAVTTLMKSNFLKIYLESLTNFLFLLSRDCPEVKCTKEQFKCDNGKQCIHNGYRCDGLTDCLGK